MKYNIIGKNIEVTEGIRTRVTKKLSELEKFFAEPHDNYECRVLVRVYSHTQKIEVTISTKLAILRAEEVNPDLYAAIDLIVDKLQSQMSRVKTRLDKTHREKLSKILRWDIIDNIAEDDIQYVKTKSVVAESLDLDEAIAKMELLGHRFFVYHDIDDDKKAIVYKRDAGGYGVILVD